MTPNYECDDSSQGMAVDSLVPRTRHSFVVTLVSKTQIMKNREELDFEL